MNISKEKKCIFGDHAADVSLMYVISTVGVKPRRQRGLKTVPVCFSHIHDLAPLVTSDAAQPSLDNLQTLTARREALARITSATHEVEKRSVVAVIDATAAAIALNRHRWGKKRS